MPRQKYSSGYKVQTVLEGLKSADGISAFCRRKGISEVQFYQWQKQMISNADSTFEKVSKATQHKIARLEEEIKRKDQIIALVTEEALELKKKLIS
jgi:transposase-like protein